MEEKKNAGAPSGMAKGSNIKKSDSKRKKSGAKGSKRRSGNKPEPGQGPANDVEAETETAPGHVESSSTASQKRKSGPAGSAVEDEQIGEVPAEKTTGRSVVEERASGKSDAEPSRREQARKAKKIKNGNDGARMEPLASDGILRQLRPRKQQEIMRHVTLTDVDTSRVIGRKIEVFWPMDDEWYPGHVKSFDEKKKRHRVLYDDGDQEWLKLKNEKFKLQVYPGETFGKPVQSVAESADAPLGDDSKNNKGKGKDDGGAQKHKKIDGKHEEEEEEEEEGQQQREEDKEEKGNKNNLGKDESQDQAVEGVPGTNMRKSSKRTAPRTKRLGSIKQVHQKHASNKDQTENAEKKQESIEQTDAKQDAKQDEESRMTSQMKPSVAVSLTGDSMDDKGGGKQPKQKQIDDFTGKKNEASDLGGSEQMMDLMDVKQTNVKQSAAVDTKTKGLKLSEQGDEIQVEKLSEEVEGLDEKEASGIVTDQLDEKETCGRQVPKQCNDDEMETRSKTTNQQDEKDSDAKEHDDKGAGEQEVVKGSDPVSKKHSNKKHRGRAKARETGKR